MAWELKQCDCLTELRKLPDESVNCCVTSPPYWGLRDYGVDGQLGLEPTPEEYTVKMVEVFREVKRVLRKDGTLWLNLGDSYASNISNNGGYSDKSTLAGFSRPDTKGGLANESGKTVKLAHGLKPKDLVGIPWRVAFALQKDGWYLRSDIIWAKPNPMPESVTDRPTKAHEYIFLLSKSERYYYDAEAIKEPITESSVVRLAQDIDNQAGSQRVPGKTNGPMKAVGKKDKQRRHSRRHAGFNDRWNQMTTSEQHSMGRNKRTVWNIATKPFSEAHFAVFPPEIPEICIKAGCPEQGWVLDPFAGSGTTLMVAAQLWRNAIGIELNPEYCELIKRRMAGIEVNLFQ
ncbi:MAG: site-specific DNA-methyltransferase [Syntrophomonas sp.]|nr:site-specific DNA-methyltransferase [Syntrophomonas sp.]